MRQQSQIRPRNQMQKYDNWMRYLLNDGRAHDPTKKMCQETT